MLTTLTTLAAVTLVIALAVFAFCAVLLNEAEHSTRRRSRRRPPDQPAAEGGDELLLSHLEDSSQAQERLPIGDFLFGALYLKSPEPLAFAELARAVAAAGLHMDQVLTWIARAEESGFVERLAMDRDSASGAATAHPAVRLTERGIDVAGNNRRGARHAVAASADDDAALA